MKNQVVSVGSKFPEFKKKAVVSIEKGKEFIDISNDYASAEGKWTVMFWWPKDFTFVCPTEIAEFNKKYSDFDDRDAVLIGASTDSEFVTLHGEETMMIYVVYVFLCWLIHQNLLLKN